MKQFIFIELQRAIFIQQEYSFNFTEYFVQEEYPFNFNAQLCLVERIFPFNVNTNYFHSSSIEKYSTFHKFSFNKIATS